MTNVKHLEIEKLMIYVQNNKTKKKKYYMQQKKLKNMIYSNK